MSNTWIGILAFALIVGFLMLVTWHIDNTLENDHTDEE